MGSTQHTPMLRNEYLESRWLVADCVTRGAGRFGVSEVTFASWLVFSKLVRSQQRRDWRINFHECILLADLDPLFRSCRQAADPDSKLVPSLHVNRPVAQRPLGDRSRQQVPRANMSSPTRSPPEVCSRLRAFARRRPNPAIPDTPRSRVSPFKLGKRGGSGSIRESAFEPDAATSWRV